MKKLLFTLALLISFNSFTQENILTIDQMISEYPNYIVGYHNSDGEILFDGEVNSGNIDDNRNHPDFNNISYEGWLMFEGDYFESAGAIVKFYCDENGYPTSVKEIIFKDEQGYIVGTEISYWKNGKIKSLKHNPVRNN